MARIEPLTRDDLGPAFEVELARVEERFGFIPNSVLTLGRRPNILRAIQALSAALETGTVDRGLRRLVAYAVSISAGCRYCQAHTSAMARNRLNVLQEQIDSILGFENSPLFDNAERAALRVAFAAGQTPNGVTDEMFAEMRRYFSDDECVEIVSMIAYYGFFNRWNDTVGTVIEPEALEYASEHLVPVIGWDPAHHTA